ncbi:MAG: NUDIX hydrolase [Gammaproteobacteria bacterium]|nr:NUDIX hydrolase [Gammaproteobacteria bacterium]
MSKYSVPAYYLKQSAVVPYRKKKGKLEILLITSRRKKRWIIPKGVIEQPLTPQQSAAKEGLEEAGIQGKVSKAAIGSYQFQKWNKTCTVKVYCMKVEKAHKVWRETWRKRKWVSLDTAGRLIQKKKLRNIILSLPEFLQDKPIKWI